jgi:hypothetical protein
MQWPDRANSRPTKRTDVNQQPTPLEGNLEGNSPGILKVVLIPQEVTSQFGSSPGHHSALLSASRAGSAHVICARKRLFCIQFSLLSKYQADTPYSYPSAIW